MLTGRNSGHCLGSARKAGTDETTPTLRIDTMAASRPSTYFVEYAGPLGRAMFLASPAGTSTTDATAAYPFANAADALAAFKMVLPQHKSRNLPGCKVRTRVVRPSRTLEAALDLDRVLRSPCSFDFA